MCISTNRMLKQFKKSYTSMSESHSSFDSHTNTRAAENAKYKHFNLAIYVFLEWISMTFQDSALNDK